jgi:3-dehydroquinate synthase
VVAGDERERGNRALLNLGHTFGHAIETATDYSSWLHGEAVAAGMVMAADLSVREERMAASARDRIVDLLRQLALPTAPPAMSAAEFLSLMGQDKKVERGQIRLVLMNGIGEACVTADFDPEALDSTLSTVPSAS